MKKFLLILFVFVLIVGLITSAINGLYLYNDRKTPDTMSSDRNNDAQIKNVPSGIQLCNFGSSHGMYGFDYENVEDRFICYNFGQTSQFISYDYRILQNYIDNFDKGAVVFITISHFSLFGPPDITYENFASLNKRYYKFLDDDLIKEYDAKTDFFVSYAPSLVSDDIVSLFKGLLGIRDSSVWNEMTDAQAAAEHAYSRYSVFIKEKMDENGERLYNEEEIAALYNMIALCQDRGLVPILVTTPYLSEYNDSVRENDPEFYDDFYSLIGKVVSDTGVRYFDYSCDPCFIDDYSLFYNTDHLNRNGAQKFTGILIEETGCI